MALAQEHGQVGHRMCEPRLAAQRSGAYSAAGVVHDFLGGLLDGKADPHRDTLCIALRMTVDPCGGFAQQRSGCSECDFNSAQMGQPVGIGLRPG